MSKATRLAAILAAAIFALSAPAVVQAQNVHAALTGQLATPQNIVLFFDEDSAALTDDAKIIVHDAVRAAERAGSFRIALTAYSARDELKLDPQIVSRRAAAVRAEIENFGFEGDVVAAGGSEPKLVTANHDTLSRRVVIRVEG